MNNGLTLVIATNGADTAVLLDDANVTDCIHDIAFRAIEGEATICDIGRIDMTAAKSKSDFFQNVSDILGYKVTAQN